MIDLRSKKCFVIARPIQVHFTHTMLSARGLFPASALYRRTFTTLRNGIPVVRRPEAAIWSMPARRFFGSVLPRSPSRSLLLTGPEAVSARLPVSTSAVTCNRLFSTSGTVYQKQAQGEKGQGQDQSGGQGQKTKKHPVRRAVYFVAGSALLAGLGYWAYLYHLQEEPPEPSEPQPDPPPEVYIHPFTNKPWWWRWFFAFKRTLYLAWVFLPVGWRLLINVIWPTEETRAGLVETFLRAMERGGACFMKLGQWISMRPDLFTADVIAAMSHLRTGVPPHSMEHTREEIRRSFGKELEEIFESFDEEPSASGTVAQVHRAVLKDQTIADTHQVAVKIRHPNAVAEAYMDLDIIFYFVDTFLPHAYALPCSQGELARIIQQQLDFRWEAYNLSQFARNFHAELAAGLIHFPRVTKSLVSDSVLVESWAEGDTIASMFSEIHSTDGKWANTKDVTIGDKFSTAAREKKKQLAALLFDINAKMFLRDNMAHADMHAGNLIFSMQDGRVTLIDAGLASTLGPDAYNAFGDFMRGLCAGNVDTITTKLIEFNVSSAPLDKAEFRQSVEQIVSKWSKSGSPGSETAPRRAPDGTPEPLPSPALGDLVGALLINLQKHRMKLRGDVAAAIMTISIAEGLILQLDPDFDVVMGALPYFVK